MVSPMMRRRSQLSRVQVGGLRSAAALRKRHIAEGLADDLVLVDGPSALLRERRSGIGYKRLAEEIATYVDLRAGDMVEEDDKPKRDLKRFQGEIRKRLDMLKSENAELASLLQEVAKKVDSLVVEGRAAARAEQDAARHKTDESPPSPRPSGDRGGDAISRGMKIRAQGHPSERAYASSKAYEANKQGEKAREASRSEVSAVEARVSAQRDSGPASVSAAVAAAAPVLAAAKTSEVEAEGNQSQRRSVGAPGPATPWTPPTEDGELVA